MQENGFDLLQKIDRPLSLLEKQNLLAQLQEHINNLLQHNFPLLVQLLYRADVSEKKLRGLLQQHASTDAALLIAQMLLQRQEEKIKTRQSSSPGNRPGNDEAW